MVHNLKKHKNTKNIIRKQYKQLYKTYTVTKFIVEVVNTH